MRLIPALDDPPLSNPEYQKLLGNVYDTLRSQGVQVSARYYVHDAADGGGGLAGEFIIVFTNVSTIIAGVAGAWIQAKYGRKLRVKFGDIEVEAPTLEQLEKALQLIEKSQQEDTAKGTHKP